MNKFMRSIHLPSVAIGAGGLLALMLIPVVSKPIIDGVVFLRKKIGVQA